MESTIIMIAVGCTYAHNYLDVEIINQEPIQGPGKRCEKGHDGEGKRHGVCALGVDHFSLSKNNTCMASQGVFPPGLPWPRALSYSVPRLQCSKAISLW